MSKKINSGILFAVMSFTILPLYQNCSNNFDFAKEANFALTQGEAEIVDVYINPNSWENRPKINISAIVDNSHSMADIQAKVSAALQNSLTPLSDFSGEIELYSTTQDLDAEDSMLSVVSETISRDDTYLGLPRTSSVMYNLPESFTFDGSGTQGPLIYTPENLDLASIAFGNSVTNLGIKGSSNEEGICSLLRVIDKAKSNPGSLNVFVLVSDQDDGTDYSKCINSSHSLVLSSEEDKIINCSSLSDSEVAAIPSCRFQAKLNFTKAQASLTRLSASVSLPNRIDTQAIRPDYSKRAVRVHYKSKDTFRVYYNYQIENRTSKIQIDTFNEGFSVKDGGLYKSGLEFRKSYAKNNMSCSSQGFSLSNGTWSRSCSSAEKNYFTNLNAKDNEGNPVTMVAACSSTCRDLDPQISYTPVTNSATGDIIGSCPTDLSGLKANYCSAKPSNCNIRCVNKTYSPTSIYKSGSYIASSCNSVNSNSSTDFSGLEGILTTAALSNSSKNSIRSKANADTFIKVDYGCSDYDYVVLNTSSSYKKLNSYQPLSANLCSSEQITSFRNRFSKLASANFSCYQKAVAQGNKSVVINQDVVWNGSSVCSSADLSLIASNQQANVSDINSCARLEVSQPSLNKIDTIEYAGAKVCDSLSNSEIKAQMRDFVNDNPGYLHSNCVNSGKVGQYEITVDIDSNNQVSTAFIDWDENQSKLDLISRYMADNLEFQLATFTTPKEGTSEYAKCPVSEIPNAPVPYDEGQVYTELVDKVRAIDPTLAANYNICDDDYGIAFQRVVDRVIVQAELTYRISLAPYESVYKVFLVSFDGKEQQLGAGDYDIVNSSLLRINKDAVELDQEISSIRVQIWRDLLAKKEYELRAPAND